MFTLTLTFTSLQELHAATGRLATVELPPKLSVIAHADRPDVGREEPDLDVRTGLPHEPLVASAAYNPFAPLTDMPAPATGAAYNPFAPATSVSAPLPDAPSTAVAAASPTAPATPPAGLPPPPPVTLPPALPTGSAAGAPGASVPPQVFVPTAERDANGLPWDHRIHGSTRTRNADHTWRQKRGVDKALVAQVEAELRQAVNAVAPAAPAAPAAPPVPPAPPAAAAMPATFAGLMEALAPHMSSGKISNLTVAGVLGESKLANLFQLAQVSPDVLAAVSRGFAPHLAAANAT